MMKRPHQEESLQSDQHPNSLLPATANVVKTLPYQLVVGDLLFGMEQRKKIFAFWDGTKRKNICFWG